MCTGEGACIALLTLGTPMVLYRSYDHFGTLITFPAGFCEVCHFTLESGREVVSGRLGFWARTAHIVYSHRSHARSLSRAIGIGVFFAVYKVWLHCMSRVPIAIPSAMYDTPSDTIREYNCVPPSCGTPSVCGNVPTPLSALAVHAL